MLAGCDGAACDRHLSHAHDCVSSSKKKIRDRHDTQATAEAGFTRIHKLGDACSLQVDAWVMRVSLQGVV